MKKVILAAFIIIISSYINEKYAQTSSKKVNISFDYTKRAGYSSRIRKNCLLPFKNSRAT